MAAARLHVQLVICVRLIGSRACGTKWCSHGAYQAEKDPTAICSTAEDAEGKARGRRAPSLESLGDCCFMAVEPDESVDSGLEPSFESGLESGA